VVASIGVWGAEKAILGARHNDLTHMLLTAAGDVSRDLGFVETATPECVPAVADA